MSISTDVAAVARLTSVCKRSVGITRGRLLRRLALVATVAPVAYVVGAHRSAALAHEQLEKLAELQLRLERLERLERSTGSNDAERPPYDTEPSAAEKERIASHYEVLANQLACEDRLADLTQRLAMIERTAPMTITNS